MIFESLWPLALLFAVPVVIILYLLKPKGKDYRISSILLWEKCFKNRQSKTFLEKFVHNILMYLQIFIILLLVLALMSPYISREGKSRGNVILVLDTSGSMQHDGGDGRKRIEQAVDTAKELIGASDDTVFSIVTNDCGGTNLLAVGTKDKAGLYAALDGVACCDGAGNLPDAESVVETLRGSEEDGTVPEVIVFTDGGGAEDAAGFADYFDAEVYVLGSAVSNVSNNFLSYVPEDSDGADEEPAVSCASSLTNYSDAEASLEVSLYAGESLVQVKQVTIPAKETTLCFFDPFVWRGEALRSEIGGVRFAGLSEGDSLAEDNTAFAVYDESTNVEAVLVGDGNTYIEKAYQAAVGTSPAKVKEEAALSEEDTRVRIYDAGVSGLEQEKVSALVFGGESHALDTVESVMLGTTECDLTQGLSSFGVGVNETKVYDVPEWATGFFWAGEACAAYYGEHDGVKTVVVGFDIRESDFPLKAEFPVFMSNVLRFLGDTSLLAGNVYEAGDTVLFHPQADFDVGTLTAETAKAGLYDVTAGDVTEQYVVRFAAGSESDGQLTAESTAADETYQRLSVKKRLRNVLLVIVLLLLVLEWIVYVRQMRGRNQFYLAVRVLVAAMLVAALAGVSVSRKDAANTTIFLVDISNSNEQNLSKMEDYLSGAISQMPKDNQYGIVTFGKNSLVEQFLTREDHFSSVMSVPDKTATNFEDAMSRALAMIPANGAGRVVILTDGKETKGSIAATASALVARQVELLARTFEVSQGQDCYIEDVKLPSYLYQGDRYTMTVTVESNYDTDAQLQIWTGTMQTDAYDVHLNRGTNRFQFRQTVEGESVESFEVRVAAPGDTCEENNRFHAYSVVDSVPKVLLVSGMGEDCTEYEKVLRAAGCNFNTVSALNAPDTLEGLLEYKSILLENVYISDLPAGFLENVDTYVKDYGCGLVCMGGDDSFALGGYRESVLETVLPVDMELRGVDEIPSMAMIMVIDHSGSMSMGVGGGATNLDLAITAAETAVDQMRSSDYVGVIAFDDMYQWIVEPTKASDKEGIKAQIETIAEGGGTTIKPSLWAALEGIKDCDASIRHVILLTDGQGESKNFSDITAAYNDADVTLSSVAVGDGSDASLLKQISEDCGGRYYYSDMASDIPKIFAQEVFLSGDTYLQNGTFRLAVNSGNEITGGLFADGWPSIFGYVSATPKSASRVLIASEKDDPVLTTMQYGLGHTVAWNTDVTNEWTAGYAGKDDYVQLWKRIVDYSAGSAAMGEDAVDVVTAGGSTSIVYDAKDYGEQTKVEAVYTDPEGNTRTEPLPATAPGRYEARLDTDMTGVYNLSVRRVDDGSIVNAVTTAAVVQYSDEYKFGVSTAAFTGFVERYGAMLDPEDNFWKQRKSETRERYELTRWLLLFATLLFVLDIAFRRFHFRPQDTGLYRVLSERIKRRRAARAAAGGKGPGRGGKSGEKAPVVPADSGEGADTSRTQSEAAVVDAPAAESAGEKKRGRERKREKKKQEPQALDTSALLKKKDQRNHSD